MGGCFILGKDNFLNQMRELIKEDDAVIFSTIKQGNMGGASKNKYKHFEIGFPNYCFKSPKDIRDLIDCVCGGIILLKKEYQTNEIKKAVAGDKK